MFKKKSLIAVVLTSILLQPMAMANNVQLPDMGTAASSTLSIGQEIEMGDYYVRALRGSAPLNSDLLITDYINALGAKLVSHADSVQTPFNFFVMNSNVLNAFAFFGGNVVIHSRLILDTDNESQLASVMSHEISHVTQRHLARSMEDQKKSTPYIVGAALGSILLGLANPELGMSGLITTLAGSQQNSISFTQSNEQEADRVGLRTLTKSGFDPYAMVDFLQKLSDESRFSSKPPEMLLTHPLPDSRLADIRNRSSQLPHKNVPSSLDYYLAKIRLAIFSGNKNNTGLILDEYKKINNKQTNIALIYGQALSQYVNKDYNQAQNTLQSLLNKDPDNIWFVDLITDIDIKLNNQSAAITRLQTALKSHPNSHVLQINLANAYLNNNELQKAASLLHRYTYSTPNDINGWDLLAQTYAKQHLRGEEMYAQAELSALQGNYPQAITLLTNAQSYVKDNPNQVARFQTRAKQLGDLQKRYANYQR